MIVRLFVRALLPFCLLLGGCASLGYYGQMVGGHLDVMRRQVPLSRAIADPESRPATRERLQRIEAIRGFAVAELKLPAGNSYRSYADLERPYALWNVFAAPEFELKPLQSCFPLVGCLSYRGYYREQDARAHADELRQRGYDVHVGGVAAYSTLGWFDDPVLNTMLRWSDTRLAGVIFHELAHQKLFVPDDTSFNESFATIVQEEGLRRWLDRLGDEALRRATVAEAQRREDFVRLLQSARRRLQQLYASRQQPEKMRAAKARIFEEMRGEYAQIKAGWGGHNEYDAWFESEINNAKLLAVATYHEWVPAFRALLEDSGHDLDRFYADAELASRLPPESRRRWLSGWSATAP